MFSIFASSLCQLLSVMANLFKILTKQQIMKDLCWWISLVGRGFCFSARAVLMYRWIQFKGLLLYLCGNKTLDLILLFLLNKTC